MSKLFSKTVKKTTLWSVIIAVVLAAAIVVCALFGFNEDVTLKDAKTLTVSVNAVVDDAKKKEVVDVCESHFGDLKAKYYVEGDKVGDEYELVFVFDKGADLSAVKTAIAQDFENKRNTEAAWSGSFIDVSEATEISASAWAKHFALRAAIAGVVLAVLALAYVAIRYKNVLVGCVVGGSALLGMLLTAALMVLSRTYVTTTVTAVIGLAGLLTTVIIMLTLGKVRSAKEEGASTEEAVVSSIAVKETKLLAIALIVGLVLVGILGKTAGAWFAVSAIFSVVASLFVGLFFAPAAYLSVQTALDNKPSKGYVGAKKTSTKEKKSFVKKAPVVEEAVAAPVEEAAEAPVETEEKVEEPVAESEEAPVEEPVEETEATEETEEATQE